MANKQQIKNAGKFVGLLVIIFAVLFFVSAQAPKNFFERATATTSNTLFSIIGIHGTLSEQDNELFIQIENGPNIFFSELCTGLLETILLAAAILATFEISMRKRIFGAIVGAITIILLNQFRILATTLAIMNASIQTAELAHNILFRIFLFFAIAGLYAGWYSWALKLQKLTQN